MQRASVEVISDLGRYFSSLHMQRLREVVAPPVLSMRRCSSRFANRTHEIIEDPIHIYRCHKQKRKAARGCLLLMFASNDAVKEAVRVETIRNLLSKDAFCCSKSDAKSR